MKIQKTSTVQHIFDQFNNVFPYLKLEFFSKGHEDHKGNKPEDIISHSTLLSSINPELLEKDFIISEEMTVSAFEQMMKDNFNLNVQVFRKSNDLWLQTTATDHWTLQKQNGKGQRSTVKYDIDTIDITDFDVD
ncbi:MAG: hypothetical protein IPK35_04145 [Saprospiraceae bacterium]|jgi:hypothetical protein|nr:hypothetical protein [Saprospiraceae bacterium]